ncbi:AMP-binding protein [Halieaceae bacterium IMCC8485]|uniref:AMP-binding protein n=1 Tax=Candidatus Seongchinamella marina TaxID=2518990 RepID=A0ABT3T1N7_9GAMM|nr:AMP-binding protein [Candidatus Seongchinamella marina]MCX2975434.1 AMP-binding protein [Candidatus Seongchinamella marina]
MTVLNQSYYCGVSSSQIIYETIGCYLERICEQYPENEALVVRHQGIRWTYREFQIEIDRLSSGLLAIGIEAGDRVGIWGPNSSEWVLVQYATAQIGAIMVCINPAYRLHELEYVLNKVECRAIITAESFKTSQYLDMLVELAPELARCRPGELKSRKLPQLETVIRMGEEATPGMFNFAAVCKMGGEAEYQRLDELDGELNPDDPINIQFTSGTTGSPKGATLSHCNILNNGYLTGEGMQLTHHDKLCIPVPLYHCFGMVLGNLACVVHGATAVYPDAGFDPLTTLQAVEEEKCTALHGVPTMFIGELDHPRFGEFDLSSLRTGVMAGAPCPVEVMKRVIDEMNMKHILIGYGQTEVSPINHLTLPEDSLEKRTETVGRAVPWVEIKLIDDDNQVVQVGEKGEICTRGYSVMRGYWNDDERTRETIDIAGWLHSGDLGVMDTEGYVSVVGRIKDMIIRGGENIYPREVEDFLYTHPDIAEAQVFGIPDDRMGEEVCVWVQLHPGESMSEEELRGFCNDKIAHFKIPRHIWFVEEFPMTVTGKIQKFVMRAKTLSELSLS